MNLRNLKYPEDGQDPNGLDDPDIINEDAGRKGHENHSRHYGHQVDDAVDVPDIIQSVGRAVKPEHILEDENGDDKNLKLPEQVPQAAGNIVGIDHKDGHQQEVEKDDGDVYRFSQGGLKIDHVELDSLSQGSGSRRVFASRIFLPGGAW